MIDALIVVLLSCLIVIVVCWFGFIGIWFLKDCEWTGCKPTIKNYVKFWKSLY